MTARVYPVFPKVLLIVFDLFEGNRGSQPVRRILRWNDPDDLTATFTADISQASGGYCNYQIVEKISVPEYPVKEDGFNYSASGYLRAWQERKGFHEPDWADFHRIVEIFGISKRVRNKEIDEVWLFAGPYAGFYESRMVGPGAFWCNSPALNGISGINRRLVLMGFNYERGVGEMLESFGHRAESIMEKVYEGIRGNSNLWKRFIRYDKTHKGAAEVGSIHYAPNSQRDYDWGNRNPVASRCDTWLNFPDLSGLARMVDCRVWGNGDTRLHHLWWLRHLPHTGGHTGGISNNWWEYIVNPNLVG